MMSRQGTTAFGNEVGVGDVVIIGRFYKGVDAVVDILLNAVIDATFAITASGSVVVDTQTATTIDELDVEAHRVELNIVLSGFAKSCTDTANLVNLATDVEVNEAQTIAKSKFVEHLKSHQQLRRVQPELRSIASTLAPFTASVASQLDANTKIGMHAKFLCSLGNDGQFWEFLDNEEDAFAHLLSQESQLDEVLVLMSVTDNETVAIHIGYEDGMKLRLRTSFQSKIVTFSVTDNLFNNRPHLVHFHRENDEMLALVFVLLRGLAEALVGLLDAIVQNVWETKQDGSGYVASGQLVHHLFEVHLNAVLFGRYINVSFSLMPK